MRILIVSSFLAFRETRSGGSKRMYNIARSLEGEHELSVVCFDGSHELPQWNGQSCFRRFLPLADDRRTGSRKWSHPLDFRSLLAARRIALAAFLGREPFDCVILGYPLAPNLHAVTWYLDAVHPILKARHPGYRFAVAGMNIPDALRTRAAADPSLLILGPLDDLEPYYRRISFAVNPIVSGKGVRTKVVEAAAYGRAIVSTSLGADGTEPLYVNRGDGAEAFADACSRLIRNGSEAESILKRNREIVETGFSDAAIRDRLLTAKGSP